MGRDGHRSKTPDAVPTRRIVPPYLQAFILTQELEPISGTTNLHLVPIDEFPAFHRSLLDHQESILPSEKASLLLHDVHYAHDVVRYNHVRCERELQKYRLHTNARIRFHRQHHLWYCFLHTNHSDLLSAEPARIESESEELGVGPLRVDLYRVYPYTRI